MSEKSGGLSWAMSDVPTQEGRSPSSIELSWAGVGREYRGVSQLPPEPDEASEAASIVLMIGGCSWP